MKAIKIIDLLNKIANGEELPQKIKYLATIYTLRKNLNYYKEGEISSYKKGLYYQLICGERLNDIVIILD